MISVSGYASLGFEKYCRYPLVKISALRYFVRHYANCFNSTITYCVHNAPGDYYWFSPETVREVFLEGMYEVDIRTIMLPSRIIGVGVKSQ